MNKTYLINLQFDSKLEKNINNFYTPTFFPLISLKKPCRIKDILPINFFIEKLEFENVVKIKNKYFIHCKNNEKIKELKEIIKSKISDDDIDFKLFESKGIILDKIKNLKPFVTKKHIFCVTKIIYKKANNKLVQFEFQNIEESQIRKTESLKI